MKNLIALVVWLSAVCTLAHAQEFQGIATYKQKSKMDIKLDSTMNPEMQKRIKAMVAKQSEREYELVFEKNQSTYKKLAALNAPEQSSGGMVVVMSTGDDGILYKNIQEKRFTNETSLFGKPFLIQDVLKKEDWKLEKESKQIGQYTCYKATRESEVTVFNMVSKDGEEDKNTEEKRSITITAWYTPQIPVSNGPSDYWGLPGLIMEVNTNNNTLICTKVVLNPENKKSIKEPSKGQKLNQDEYNEMMATKMKEFEKMNEGNRKKGDGHSIQISIGDGE